jgi:hypothetical protein
MNILVSLKSWDQLNTLVIEYHCGIDINVMLHYYQ